MDPLFDIRLLREGEVEVLNVLGEIDLSNAAELTEAIEGAAGRGGRVVVNLTDVTFLDSSGLAALLQSERALTERSIVLTVVVPAEGIVRRVFEITNLLESLGVVESMEVALGLADPDALAIV